MHSTLSTASSFAVTLEFPRIQLRKPNFVRFVPIRASGGNNDVGVTRGRIVEKIKRTAGVVFLTAVTTAMIGRFGQLPAMAETPMTTVSEEIPVDDKSEEVVEEKGELVELLQDSEAVEVLKALLLQKLENKEDELALKVVKQLVEAQPEVAEWRYFKARILNEMDLTEEARNAFEEILKVDPFNYEALFENALLMIRRGEGGVIERLEEALRIAEVEGKGKEARDVTLLIAQMKFLQNDVDEALICYDELIREDPNDFRTYFSKGMIYSMTNRTDKAKEEFAKYKKLSPEKVEVQGFLRTPLSRMLVYGTSDPNLI